MFVTSRPNYEYLTRIIRAALIWIISAAPPLRITKCGLQFREIGEVNVPVSGEVCIPTVGWRTKAWPKRYIQA